MSDAGVEGEQPLHDAGPQPGRELADVLVVTMQDDKIQAVHVADDPRQLGFLFTQLGSACHLPFGGAILTGAIPAKKGTRT